MANLKVNGENVVTQPSLISAVNAVKSKCEQISNYSGYATGNHSLISGKAFSNYHTLIFVFQCTQDGAGEYYYVTLPQAVFSASTTQKHAITCSTANTSRYMNFKYVNDTTFNIVNSSYVEMREIWGIN